MKKLTLLTFFLLSSFVLSIVLSSFTFAGDDEEQTRDNTAGTVTFSATTKPAGGNFSPRNVLAIWVEKDGEFVKTRKAMANQRKQYLYTWRAASNYNVVDAITGATLNSHQSHTIEWDCTDLDGEIVSDGTYTILIEFTEKHGQGPIFSVDFEKGSEVVSILPPDEQYFTGLELSYEPDLVPMADFMADVQQSCTNETVVFTDVSTGATTWDWDFGADASPATSTAQGPHNVTYASAGSKTVSLTINGSVVQTKNDYITISPDAMADFTWTQQSRTITFTNTSQNAVSYEWNFGDGSSETSENPVHTYEDDGVYEVTLIAMSELCADSEYIEEITINTVGMDELLASSQVQVYPNPGKGIFYLSSALDLSQVFVKVFDVQGRLIYEKQHEVIHAGSEVSGGYDHLQPGLYFMDVQSDQGQWLQKLLVK